VGGTGFAEFGEHDGAGDAAVGGDREGVAGVVVEPAQDLDMGVIGEPPVGEVGLPAFVGLLGGKPDVGGFGPLLRLRADQPGRAQMPVDRRCPDGQAVMVAQMPGDRRRPVVEAFAGQIGAQGDDQVGGLLGQPGRAGMRPAGAGLECGLALQVVAGHQPADPALRNPILTGHLRLAATLDDNSGND